MSISNKIDFSTVKAVIFDVDGTLYKQRGLRKKMLFKLLAYYAVRPLRLNELKILASFRAEREKRSPVEQGSDLENAQYRWCAEKMNCEVEEVQRVVDRWIFQFPNPYLVSHVYAGTHDFFRNLQQKGIRIGIYSDYKAVDKMKAMNLPADIVVSSTDAEIDKFKPHPKGLLHIAEKLGFSAEQCLFIGDRQELDGLCASNANMPYLIIDGKSATADEFYPTLNQQLNKTNQAN